MVFANFASMLRLFVLGIIHTEIVDAKRTCVSPLFCPFVVREVCVFSSFVVVVREVCVFSSFVQFVVQFVVRQRDGGRKINGIEDHGIFLPPSFCLFQ